MEAKKNIDAKYTIKVDADKNYKDYIITEKVLYNIAKSQIPQTLRNKIEGKKEVSKK